jgi:hypothetical protein
MFSGRRDRVWSDNSTHLFFYCSLTGRIPHVVLVRHITNRVAIQSTAATARKRPAGF